MEKQYAYGRPRPSFFFPIALITAGVIWLLVNSGRVPVDNVYRLLPYWPILLILAGLSILLRHIWWPLNLVLWGGAAVLVVAAVIAPPAFLPKAPTAEVKHQVLTAPGNGVKSAAVGLHLSIYPATIHALTDSGSLITADVYSTGTPRLDVSGGDRKDVQLQDTFGSFAWWRFDQIFNQTATPWDIRLNGGIPMDLTVNASTGSSNLDLSGLSLSSLRVDASTGSMEVKLPASSKTLPVTVQCSTGSMRITIPDNTPVDMSLDASTGGVTINLPKTAGVQVTVTSNGTGGLSLAPGFEKMQGDANKREGVYQNAAYNTAAAPIKIRLDMSTGGVNIR